MGLTEAIHELVGLSGLRGTVLVRGLIEDQQVDSAAALLLYHAVAEAMTNAVKHGGASGVDVTLMWNARTVEVTVVDNGAGPDDLERASSSSGLAGLGERAEMLGGGMAFGRDSGTAGARLAVWTPRGFVEG